MNVKNNTWFKVLVGVVVLSITFTLTRTYGYRFYKVDGRSMYPTLGDKSVIWVNCWYHRINGLSRGDMVVLKDNDGFYVVKRVIALPGETIRLDNGVVLINEHPLMEHYLPRNVFTSSSKMEERPLKLKEDEYFIMGDNRLTSIDSREYGPVKLSSIIGTVR